MACRMDDSEKTIQFYLEAFFDYITGCVDWKDIVSGYPLFTPDQKQRLFEFCNSQPHKGSEKCIEEIIKLNREPGKFRAFLETMTSAGNTKVVHILQGKAMPEDDKQKDLIHKFGTKICNQLNPIEILPSLLTDNVLNDRDAEVICQRLRNQGKWHASFELMFLLPKRIPHWFKAFMKVLRENEYEDLADTIDERHSERGRTKIDTFDSEAPSGVGSIRENVQTDYQSVRKTKGNLSMMPSGKTRHRSDSIQSTSSRADENELVDGVDDDGPNTNVTHLKTPYCSKLTSTPRTPSNNSQPFSMLPSSRMAPRAQGGLLSGRMQSPYMTIQSRNFSTQGMAQASRPFIPERGPNSNLPPRQHTNSRPLTAGNSSNPLPRQVSSSRPLSAGTSSNPLPRQVSSSRPLTAGTSSNTLPRQVSSTGNHDKVVGTGKCAFSILKQVAGELHEQRVIDRSQFQRYSKMLDQSNHYLQNDFQGHISRRSEVADHCLNFALSDRSNERLLGTRCDHSHLKFCEQCEQLKDILGSINTDSSSRGDERQLVDKTRKAIQDIFTWKKHIVRSRNQNEAMSYLFESMPEDEVLLVCDWANTYLQGKSQVTPTERYSKKGISWHITVAFKKCQRRNIESTVFVHLFSTPISLNSQSTCSVIMDVIDSIQSKYGRTMFNLWSDNAPCYKSNETLCLLYTSGKVKTYNFCEPQDGYGVCDITEEIIRQSVATIGTAEHLKEAIDRSMRSERYTVKVVDIATDGTARKSPGSVIKSVKSYYNFSFEPQGIRAWKAYGVGQGCLIDRIPAVNAETQLHVQSSQDDNVQFGSLSNHIEAYITQVDEGNISRSMGSLAMSATRHTSGSDTLTMGWALK